MIARANDAAAADAATAGQAFWAAIFGNDAPVEIEIGSGDGAFLLARAVATPTYNLLGIEHASGKSRRLAARLARIAAPHVRALHADATFAIALIPSGSVAAYHVYFPDPWPKRRHTERRIFTPRFTAALARTLRPRGALLVATDVASYMATIRDVILDDGAFIEIAPGDDHPGFTTAFAHKYRAEGRTLHLGRFIRRARRDAVATQPRSFSPARLEPPPQR